MASWFPEASGMPTKRRALIRKPRELAVTEWCHLASAQAALVTARQSP
jgi:hypothetical protein